MPHHSHTAKFTTVSSVVGGVGKALTAKHLLLAITFLGLTMVDLYADSTDGYLVKKVLNNRSEIPNNYFKENLKYDNE